MSRRSDQRLGRISTTDIQRLPIIVVEFLDHVMGESAPAPCKTVGWLLHSDRVKLILITWLPIDSSPENIEANWEILTLVRSAVTRMRRLR